MRLRRLAGLVVLGSLLPAGPAAAAYAPQAELSFDSYGPGQAPGVTSVMRQALGEEATRTIAARFPLDFTLNPAFAVTGCDVVDPRTTDCPESSRLGVASVESPLGNGSGTVHLTTDFRLFVRFSAYGDLYQQPVTGTIHGYDDGAEIVFDNLPNIPVTESRIALDGGPRAIFITPWRCGSYEVGARFVSQSGARIETGLPIEIAGCAEELAISAVRVSRRRVARGRRPKLSWQLSRAAAFTRVVLLRAKRGGWHELASARGPAAAGENSMKLPRRWRRRLAVPGRYRLELRAKASDGAISRSTAVRFRVVGPRN